MINWTTFTYGTNPATNCNYTRPVSESNALGQSTAYTYDCVLRLPLTINGPNVSTPDDIYNIRYDTFGRTTKEWYADDSEAAPTTQYSYQWGGFPNYTTVMRLKQTGVYADINDTLWESQIADGFGRAVQTRKATGCCWASTIDIVYDAAGNKATESVPYISTCNYGCYTNPDTTQPKTAYQYDFLGRVTKVTNPVPDPDPGDTFHRNFRDIMYYGSVTEEINERGYKVAWIRDSLGRTTQVQEFPGRFPNFGAAALTTYAYDTMDRLTQVTDAASPANVTTITYDKAGRKATLNDPDSGLWQYQYWNDDLLWTQTDSRGAVTNMYYDPIGRIDYKTFTGTVPAATIDYTYDVCQIAPCSQHYSVGRLTRVVDWSGEHRYKHDVRARITTQQDIISGVTYAITRTYDPIDRERSVIYPGGELVCTSYDYQGVVESVTVRSSGSCSGSVTTTYLTSSDYNAAFEPTKLTYGNGLNVMYGYHPDYRLRSICANVGQPPALCNPGGTYSCPASNASDQLNICYQKYDGRGNLWQSYDGKENKTAANAYDHLDRLTSQGGLGDSIQYTYDALGNLLQKLEFSSLHTVMSYGAGSAGPHALTSTDSDGGAHAFTYDAAGNMLTEDVGGTNRHTYTPNANGQVASRSSSGQSPSAVFYKYDYEGNLASKAPVGQGVGTVYIGGIYEKNTYNGDVTKYYYAGGRRIAMRKIPGGSGSGTLYYLTTDNLSGTALVTNTSAAMVNRVRYFPYGAIRTQEFGGGQSTLLTDKLFTGQQRETTNEVYHYGARLYNADLGRMLQADTVVPEPGNPQALNRYSYVLNNPLRYTDPTGNCPVGIGNCPDPDFRYSLPPNQPVSGPAPCSWGTGSCCIIGGVEGYNCMTAPAPGSGVSFLGGLGVVAGTVAGVIPFVGEANDAVAVVTGCDVFAGLECGLSPRQRALYVIGFLPLVPGRFAREAGDVASDLIRTTSRGSRIIGEIPQAWRSQQRYDELLGAARHRYWKQAGAQHDHHAIPEYLGGDPKGPTVQVDAAYHQLITNEFRRLHPYGQVAPDAARLNEILEQVYSKYPLPER